ERVRAQEVDVIRDEHEIAGTPQRVHAAARIGDHQRPRAEPREHPHGQSDLLRRVALIAVKPPPHRHHPPAGEGPEEQLPGMALNGGEWKAREAWNWRSTSALCRWTSP